MARQKKRTIQGPTITIPRSANTYMGYEIVEEPLKPSKKHWTLRLFEDYPRTRWEWWRDFFVGFAFGWIVAEWFWDSRRKRRSIYLDHLGR